MGISLYRRDKGASLTGYGLVVGLIAVIAIGAISGVGGSVTELFGGVAEDMEGVSGDGIPTISSPSDANGDRF